MTSTYQRVADICRGLVEAAPEGVRFIDLRERVLEKLPDVNRNTLAGALNNFRNNLPEGLVRPVRGFYITQAAWRKRDKSKPVPTRAPHR